MHFPKSGFLVPLVLTIVIIFSFSMRGFIAWSDAGSTWFSPLYNAGNLLYLWDWYTGLGSFWVNNFTSFFLRLFYSIPLVFSSNPEFIQKFVWVLFFSLSGILIYKEILPILESRIKSAFFVLFLFFNPVSLYFLWSMQHWTYYLVVPYFLGALYYIKFSETWQLRYGLYIPLLWFFFSFGLTQPAYFAPFAFLIFCLFVFYIFSRSGMAISRYVLQNVSIAIMFFGINFVYLLPLLYGWTSVLDEQIENFSLWDRLDIIRQLSSGDSMVSAIFNISRWWGDYFSDTAILVCWMVFFLATLFFTFFNRDRKTRWILIYLVLVLLGFVFLLKGINHPFSEFSKELYSIKLMYIFRNYIDKFAIWYITTFSLIIFYLLQSWQTIIYRGVFYIFSLFWIFLFVSNDWYYHSDYSDSSTLGEYSTLSFNPADDRRILVLPLVDYSFFHSRSPILYDADNPFRNLFKRDVIFTTNLKQFKPVVDLKKSTYRTELNREKLFLEKLDELNIGYVLVNKLAFVKEEGEQFSAYDPSFLYNLKGLSLTRRGEYFDLFEVQKWRFQLINVEDGFYKKDSPIRYNIFVNDLKNARTVSFLDSFNAWWKLYPVSLDYANSCKQVDGIFEMFRCSDIGLLMENSPLAWGSHAKIYGYANSWTVGGDDFATFIKNEYWDIVENRPYQKTASSMALNHRYYLLDEDGTIGMNFVLFFWPQVYLYLGMLVSCLVLFGVACYYAVVFFRERC